MFSAVSFTGIVWLRRARPVVIVVGLRRARPIVVIALVTESHLSSRPVGIAYPKRVCASRPRCVAEDRDELLRGALAHLALWSPVDYQLGLWGKMSACQDNQERSIALRVYQDPRHRWHRITQGSQLLGAGQPHRPIHLVQQVAHGLLFLGKHAIELPLCCLALSACWQCSDGSSTSVCFGGNTLQCQPDRIISTPSSDDCAQIDQGVA